MIEPNQLLQTYIRQYQAASKKKKDQFPPPRSERADEPAVKNIETHQTDAGHQPLAGGMAPPNQKIWLILRTVRTTMLSQSSLKAACCHSSSAWMRQCFCLPSAMIFPWIF